MAIVGTFFLLRVLSTFAGLSVFALNLTTGLGLGLAIDYSLFIVSRYREEVARDGFGLAALRRTLQTAGRTVLFSSVTVAFSVAALAIFPQRFLYSMGIAGAIVALLAAALALTVLPALLAVLGPRVNALSPQRLRQAAERDARPARSGAWYRLAHFVIRRPAQVAVASAVVLIALGVPFTQIRFITADAGVLPQSASAHQVQDALDMQFPPNRTTPLEVVVGAPASSPFAVAVGAFATSQIVFIKELGIGTALAVLLDASVIRALLVPSLMALLGPLNWWAPRPLRRRHERIGLQEGAPQAA